MCLVTGNRQLSSQDDMATMLSTVGVVDPCDLRKGAVVTLKAPGWRAGTPPSLDPARSAPSVPDLCLSFDAVARADSAVWLSGGLQIVVRSPAGRPRRRSGVTAGLLGGNVAPGAV